MANSHNQKWQIATTKSGKYPLLKVANTHKKYYIYITYILYIILQIWLWIRFLTKTHSRQCFLNENGMTKREVATQFGISEDTLSRRLKESAKPQNPQNLNNNNNINNNSNSYQSTNVDCEANASTINALGIDLSKTSINEVFGEYSF